jgi:hypothetical protein
VVAELHSAVHRPFQKSASTRPVGRPRAPQRPRTDAAIPINRLDRANGQHASLLGVFEHDGCMREICARV